MSAAVVHPPQSEGRAASPEARGVRQRHIAYVSKGGQSLMPVLRACGYMVDALHLDVGTAAALQSGSYDLALVEFASQEDLTAEQFVRDVFEGCEGCPVAIVAVAEGKAAGRAFRAGARFVMDHGAGPDLVKQTVRSALQMAQSFRRRFARHELDTSVEITAGEERLVGTITEIGNGGMGVTAPTLRNGQAARFRFQLPGMSRAVDAAGVVRWKDGDSCGVEFRAFDSGGEQEVSNWIRRRETGEDPLPQQPVPEATVAPAPTQIDPWTAPRKKGMGDKFLLAVLWVFSLLIVAFWVWMLKS